MDANWLKQGDDPLFGDMLWSKPERKSARGKLLIIGGHLHGFDRAAAVYENAIEAGAGEVKVVLPDKLKPVLGKSLEQAVFVASTSAGTLSKDSSGQLKSYVEWADVVVLAQTGYNSETSLLLVNLIAETDKPIILTDDALNDIKHDIGLALRPPVMAVLSLNGLQSLQSALKSQRAISHDMGLRPLVLALAGDDTLSKVAIATVYDNEIVTIAGGQAVSTKRSKQPELAALAAWMAVWWMWQPAKPFEAMAAAAFEF
ncbi:MAG TPA: hypothetical protein VF996_00655 [Candidatus Saccharimonadales bacterium]